MSKQMKPGTGVTNKRRRELAAAKYERQAARRTERAARRRRRQHVTWGVLALLGVVAVGALLWPSTDPDVLDQLEAAGSPPAEASASPQATGVDIGCDPAPTPPADPATFDEAPTVSVDKDTDYTLALATNCGEVVIETLPGKAPTTVNSMLWLAGKGYFDSTLCHRVTTQGIYVLQCGDPTATGTGGPGYTIPDENLPEEGEANYPKGTVAMANAGKDTGGSQFFLVYDDTTLPPNYTVWGKVTSGLDIVEKVAEAGVSAGGSDGQPAAPIGIVSATVEPELG